MEEGNGDTDSQRLAETSAENIASRLTIPDRGTSPETSRRHGGLYIHHWNAPSALIEMAYLQKDAKLLRENRRDFDRSITLAILSYLINSVFLTGIVKFVIAIAENASGWHVMLR